MGINARIEPGGYVAIDTTAWLEQRTGGPDDDLTLDLNAWAATHDDAGEPATPETIGDPGYRDWPTLARTWAAHRGHQLVEPDFIAHHGTRLDTEVWILRATVGYRYKVAVIGINDDPPTVHAESCTDSGDWFDADSVEISCPNWHGWTWRTGRDLVTEDGDFTTLDAVFGPDPDAPFTPCPTCTAHKNGVRPVPCQCDRTPWIICPVPGCGRRCDVELPTY